jgi:hypothetical protein
LANPVTYQTSHPFSDLYSLHPFISSINAGITDGQALGMANQICAQMVSGGARIPASVGSERSISSSLPVGRMEAQQSRGPSVQPSLIRRVWQRVVDTLDVSIGL